MILADLNLFSQTVSWKLLSHFFTRPTSEVHVNELARNAGVASGSVSTSCRRLLEKQLLIKKKKGNALFYSLNNENPFVRRMKSAWAVGQLMPLASSWQNEEFVSVALYGSYASGEFMEKSDLDLLILGSVVSAKVDEQFSRLHQEWPTEVSLTVLPLSEWRRLAEHKERFYLEVLSNHVLLWGASLVVG